MVLFDIGDKQMFKFMSGI